MERTECTGTPLISAPRAPSAPAISVSLPGAALTRPSRACEMISAVRSMGYVASQEVVFGSMGQTLTIRHDSWDRESYMPGVLLGIRSVGDKEGLIVGLENFMG